MTESRPTFSRILLTRMKYIGDVVLTTPIIRSVRNAYPDAYIAYLGERNAVTLLEHNPHLDEIIPFDFSRPTILEQPQVILQLRQRKFDLTVDLFNNPRSALLTRLSGAGTRVGAYSRSVRGKAYTVQVKDDGKPKTAIQFHNQFIEAVGIVPVSSKTEIFLTDDEMKAAHTVLRQYRREPNTPIICIHPGATWPAKKWLPERFGELADMLVSKLGVHVILLSGPNDGEAVNAVVKHSDSDIKILHNLPLRELAAIISVCEVFVGNDAGPMHIAAAVGTPTVGLFGSGEENIWFPYSARDGHAALRKDVQCHPCHLDFCNREADGYMECMKRLETEEVFDAVAKSLQTKRR
jgi:predicted lipopolysaccharide heptosyltransferase III